MSTENNEPLNQPVYKFTKTIKDLEQLVKYSFPSLPDKAVAQVALNIAEFVVLHKVYNVVDIQIHDKPFMYNGFGIYQDFHIDITKTPTATTEIEEAKKDIKLVIYVRVIIMNL